jgi:hypothetical protein
VPKRFERCLIELFKLNGFLLSPAREVMDASNQKSDAVRLITLVFEPAGKAPEVWTGWARAIALQSLLFLEIGRQHAALSFSFRPEGRQHYGL